MSLDHILAMRRARQKPSGVVSVVVGNIPKKFHDDPLMVEIKPGVNPSLVDFRPLVGVWVSIHLVEGTLLALDQAVEALSKAGAKLFGVVCNSHANTLCIFEKPEDQKRAAYVLRAEWESLCN